MISPAGARRAHRAPKQLARSDQDTEGAHQGVDLGPITSSTPFIRYRSSRQACRGGRGAVEACPAPASRRHRKPARPPVKQNGAAVARAGRIPARDGLPTRKTRPSAALFALVPAGVRRAWPGCCVGASCSKPQKRAGRASHACRRLSAAVAPVVGIGARGRSDELACSAPTSSFADIVIVNDGELAGDDRRGALQGTAQRQAASIAPPARTCSPGTSSRTSEIWKRLIEAAGRSMPRNTVLDRIADACRASPTSDAWSRRHVRLVKESRPRRGVAPGRYSTTMFTMVCRRRSAGGGLTAAVLREAMTPRMAGVDPRADDQ